VTAYVEQPSDAAFRAFLRSLDAGLVQLDRAAGASDVEIRMIQHTTGAAA
jgi:hypothetical protein